MELIRIGNAAEWTRFVDRTGDDAFDPQCLTLHAPDATWIATSGGGAALARCSLWWRDTASSGGLPTGMIGHFAAATPEAAASLLDHAGKELRRHGCAIALGPVDGSTWRRYRLVVERGAEPPFFLEPHNPDAYPGYFRDAGFETHSEYFSAVTEELTHADSREPTMRSRFEEQYIRIRPLDPVRAEDDLGRIHSVTSKSFAGAHLYKPIDGQSFLNLYRAILPVVVPELVLIAERGDEPVGFLFGYPDRNETAGGAPARTVVVKTLACSPDRAYAGLGTFILIQFHRRAHEMGYRRAIHALMHETNVSRVLSGRWNSRTLRRYALFGRALTP